MTNWIYKNGNHASINHFGSREAAEKALDSLRDCWDCANCVDCVRCYGCVECTGCSDAVGWSGRHMEAMTGASLVPIVPDIHTRLLELVQTEDGLRTDSGGKEWTDWVVELSGEQGSELAKLHGRLQATMLIYRASDPQLSINPEVYFDPAEEQVRAIRKLAQQHSRAVGEPFLRFHKQDSKGESVEFLRCNGCSFECSARNEDKMSKHQRTHRENQEEIAQGRRSRVSS